MNKIVLDVLLFSVCCFAGNISVLTMDEQLSSKDNTIFRFKVVNNSNETIRGVELRYHVKQDSAQIVNPDIYYMPGGTARWVYNGNNSETLIISFPNDILRPGDALGGEAGYVLGLHSKTWGMWTKNDDPSQPKSSSFANATNINVFSQGVDILASGEISKTCPSVQFVEVSKDSISLEIIQQHNTDAEKLNVVGAKGLIASVNLAEAKIDSLGRKIWHGAASVQDGKRGEFWTECNGKMLSYFAYGWKPQKAQNAVTNKLWESESSFVKADFDAGFNQGLFDGQRLILNVDSNGSFADACISSNWMFYRAWEKPGEKTIPRITTPFLMRYGKDDMDSLYFSWTSMEEADWYHLIVMKDSVYGDTVVSLFTQQTSLKIPTPDVGVFVWLAEPMAVVPVTENDTNEIYYTVSEDAALRSSATIDSAGLKPMLKLPSLKKIKRMAKNALLNAAEYIAPVVTKTIEDFCNDELSLNNTGSYVVDGLKNVSNPMGVIQVMVPSTEVHARTNDIKKDLSLLQYSYDGAYVYTAYPSVKKQYIQYLQNTCFGENAFCAMKDTRMIVEKWGNGFDERNWNKIFPKMDYNTESKLVKNEAVKNRCWLTMAQMINHYKGGNISTDEILYKVRDGLDDISGGWPDETISATSYALGQDAFDRTAYTMLLEVFNSTGMFPVNVDGWFVGTPLLHTIIETIESGNVMGVSQWNDGADGTHSMVLNGYRICVNGDVYIHLLNVHNMGENEWRYYGRLGTSVTAQFPIDGIAHLLDLIPYVDISGDMFFSYYIPPLYAKGRSGNSDMFFDDDGDGVVNYDESARFGLNPNKEDTDSDGLNDYKELLDYKLCENYEKEKITRLPSFSYVASHRDSDGDGFCDKQETGYNVDAGASLCDRYDASRHPEGVEPMCSVDYNLAMLATDLVQLNDRAYCVDLQGNYCPIASYDSDGDSPYGIVLGVQAKVGNIYSAKSVFLRDRSLVFGNVETGGIVEKQSSMVGVSGIVSENANQEKLYSVIYAPVLENVSSDNVNFTTENYRAFNTNETAIASRDLGVGAANTGFVFNSYSQLIVDGNLRKQIGSLQFQAGAKLNVLSGSLEMHVGNNFQWNGEIVAESMIKAAQNIIIYYYGTETVYVQTNFAGTIVAPNAEVVIGQAYGKKYYGAIFAKRIVVHQNTIFTWVPYAPSEFNSMLVYATDRYNVNFNL